MAEEELMELLRGGDEPANEMERACFDFVRAASQNPSGVPSEIYDRLKLHLTAPQIVELACAVGFWKMYNTVHDALRVPIEGHLADETYF